ncbi:MAG TPA: hypothetical protein VI451_04340 [Anaerolineales bacterium]|nr:hypothetical protein [Anaerolineales bacterium]
MPETWAEHGGVFIPMYQREALWISFRPRYWKPNAVKVAIGKVNAVSGKPWDSKLHPEENDYLVCPPQPWLDGINAGEGYIRQFVAMPLGMGYTVEAQVTGEEKFGGIQILVYEPKPGRFPDQPPTPSGLSREFDGVLYAQAPVAYRSVGSAEMGLAAGGKMRQKIYPDPHGIDTWDPENHRRVYVHIVNSMMYREITGKEPPPTPVTARMYTEYGLPWFDLYDDKLGDISAPDALKKVKTVKEKDEEKRFATQQDDEPVEIPEDKVIKYKVDPDDEVKDGDW